MDELWLAQLLNQYITDKKKHDIIKKLDITYTVSGDFSVFAKKTAFLGCNCLHVAAIKSDLDLTLTLLNLGANVLQQGVQDGKTPLHKAVDYFKNNSGTLVWNLQGVLLERPLINELLSAEMKSEPMNIKCKSGISHLHIACMFNHSKSVLFFAKAEKCIDQTIDIDSNVLPGYTPLHCAIRYSSSEAAVILLKLGADIYVKNVEGINSVCYLIKRLLDVSDCLNMSRGSPDRYLYDREIERLDSILKVIVLDSETDNLKLVENTGLSVFHLACALKDSWIMQSYIKAWNNENVNIKKPATSKSKLWQGWTPLHFAACLNIESFEILLDNGADIRIKNANGDTAFDLAVKRRNLKKLIPFLKYHVKLDVKLSDQSTKLSDLMVAMSGFHFDEFKEKLTLTDINLNVPLDFLCWPGYNLLHMSISIHSRIKFPGVFFEQLDIPKQPRKSKVKYVQLPSISFLSHVDYWYRSTSLKANCSIYAKNADGLTPIHLAFKMREWHILDNLLIRADKNVIGPDNVSFLHIACVMGKKDVIERLLEQGSDVNSPVTSSLEWYAKAKSFSEVNNGNKTLIRANSTPLHIAVTFEMEEAVEKLLNKQANVHAQDELGLTPLYLSLASTRSIAQQLVSKATALMIDQREDGLSHLHVAAFADDEKAVRKLLRDGADVNSFISNTVPKCLSAFVGKTPLHLAVEGSGRVARALINKGADILVQNPYLNHQTPLDLAMRQLISSECKFPFDKLKLVKIGTAALLASGLTPLHIACASLDLDWTRKLLKRGANPNAQMSDGQGQANTPMHLLIAKAASAPTLPANFRSILELFVERRADVNISNNCNTPVHLISSLILDEKRWSNSQDDKTILLTIVDWLLSVLESYVINHMDVNGFSYFHFACITNNIAVIKSYLDSGVDINHATSPFVDHCGGFTPLHFAILYRNLDVVQLLLERGADVRTEDRDGNTPLHLAVVECFTDLQLWDALLGKGADINAKNVKNQTPLACLLYIININYKQFDFFVSRGALIDITETTCNGQGIIGLAMGNTIQSDVQLIFGAMIKAFHVKDAITKGFRAIHSIVTVERSRYLTREYYLNAIQRLVEKGSDIDEQDSNGKRALEKAIHFNNGGAIEALLLLGAMVNYQMERSRSCSFVEDHCSKMNLFKLDIGPGEYYKFSEPNNSTKEMCRLEVEKMKNTSICGFLSAKDFLSEWGVVIEYPSVSLAKRQSIDNFFKRPDDLHKEFPELAGILIMQYRKAVARVKLMQPVKDILIDAGINLPDLCLDAVLEYFLNDELDLWIKEAADEMPPPRKRRRMVSS